MDKRFRCIDESFSRNDRAIDLFLPSALSTIGQGALGLVSTEMPDLLPFGFGRTPMIVAGLRPCAGLVSRAHVVGFVLASQLQSSNVFDDPTLTDAIDSSITQDTDAFGPLPNGKSRPW